MNPKHQHGVQDQERNKNKPWGQWLSSRPHWQRRAWLWGPIAFVIGYWILLSSLNSMRSDHWIIGTALLIFSYGGPRLRELGSIIFPAILTGIIYDSQRFYSDWIRGPIHVQEPYYFDLRFFGMREGDKILTPNEWWQLHTHPILDFFTGLSYLIFVGVFLAQALYFFYALPKWFRWDPVRAARARFKAIRMMWGFFWLNMIGYSTYYWYAAAPPWYVANHGLGPADLTVGPNPAGCARFDELLGTHFFTGMYGRSADVFGAIPSLHVSYPFLAIFIAFELKSLRAWSVFFYLMMCFSAVYLNHHYVLDILWGSTYAVIVWAVMRRLESRCAEKSCARAQSESKSEGAACLTTAQ